MNISKINKKALTILCVDDDTKFAARLKADLEKAGDYDVVCAASGEEAWEMIRRKYFDVFLLDVHMPGLNGVELGARIRTINTIVPIMYISADGKRETKVKGYKDGGADDYCEKPIDVLVFIHKMESLVKRAKREVVSCDVIFLDEYKYTFAEMSISYKGMNLKIGLNETKLLERFMKDLNEPISKEELMKIVFGFETKGSLNAALSNLRKLFEDSETVQIQTIRGVGYCLEVPKALVRYL